MSLGTWLVLVLVVVPPLVALVWALVRDSIVRVPIGTQGLLLVRGKSTDKALPPGVHWVPALRRRQSVNYPAVELSYRASSDPVATSPVEAGGPPLRVVLGDRTEAVVSYTVRFVLTPDRLRVVHDRFGTLGLVSVPDGLAAGLLAGLNPVAGLYGYLFGTLAGALTTSSVLMSVQGTGAMSVIIADIPGLREADGPQALAALTVLTGVIMLAVGLAGLGSLVRYVPN